MKSREPGMGLIAELHAAVERALENPLAYLLLRTHPHVRRVLTRRFPYRIFYIVRSDALVVFAVLHAATGKYGCEQNALFRRASRG